MTSYVFFFFNCSFLGRFFAQGHGYHGVVHRDEFTVVVATKGSKQTTDNTVVSYALQIRAVLGLEGGDDKKATNFDRSCPSDLVVLTVVVHLVDGDVEEGSVLLFVRQKPRRGSRSVFVW